MPKPPRFIFNLFLFSGSDQDSTGDKPQLCPLPTPPHPASRISVTGRSSTPRTILRSYYEAYNRQPRVFRAHLFGFPRFFGANGYLFWIFMVYLSSRIWILYIALNRLRYHVSPVLPQLNQQQTPNGRTRIYSSKWGKIWEKKKENNEYREENVANGCFIRATRSKSRHEQEVGWGMSTYIR